MYDLQKHGFISEFYTIEKAIEVVAYYAGEDTTFKLEALKNAHGIWSIHCYIQHTFKLTSAYDIDTENRDSSFQLGEHLLWVPFSLPDLYASAKCRDAEDVLNEGLNWLKNKISAS